VSCCFGVINDGWIVLRSRKGDGESQYDNTAEVSDNGYESTSRMDGVYSLIDDYDSVAATREGYTELTVVATKIEDRSDDLAAKERQSESPEPPPPRPHIYLELIP